MNAWRAVRSWLQGEEAEEKSDPVSLGTRRAIVTFLLIMGMAVLLVAAISKILH